VIEIQSVKTHDLRFPLEQGAGVDAVHGNPVYSYAVTELTTNTNLRGFGGTFTLGAGNDVVCQLAQELAQPLIGQEIESLMANWGACSRSIADHHQYRWIGPHKGAVHLALASITNACFDLWAKARHVPLWRLLLDLTPRRILALLDLSYVEDVLDESAALSLLEHAYTTRDQRTHILEEGYRAYDTSVGWFNYSDEHIVANARKAVEHGFNAMKLKVGSKDVERDLRRVHLVREAVGENCTIMVDANQQWRWPVAMHACRELAKLNVYWIEEPTHPDDVLGHQRLAQAVNPVRIAVGEHIANRVLFKNFMLAGAARIIQVDALRVAGISEFITVSLLAKHFNLTVIPHVGDVGQLHQHMVLFNHIALDLPNAFLECIPHLREQFIYPARIENGRYLTPDTPGASFDLRSLTPITGTSAT